MKSKYFIILNFLSLSILSTAVAQKQEADTLTGQLREINVEATYSDITLEKAPFAVTYLTQDEKQRNRTPGLTLSEITSRAPGIWVNERENFALGERITIRGLGWRAAFGVRGIQVIMDGVPLTVADGQSMLDVVDPAMIQSLEVLRGPSSTLWGNSSGGVLYIKTTPPVGNNVRFKTQTGSYGLTKNEVQFSTQKDNMQLNGYTSLHNENGFRDHSAVTLSRSALNARILLNDNKSILSLNSALSVMPRANHPGSLTREQLESNAAQARSSFKNIDAGKQVTQGQLGVRLQQELSENRSFETNAFGIIRDLRNPLPFAFIDLNRKAGGLRTLIESGRSGWNFTVGTEFKFQFDDRANFNTVDGERGDELQLDQNERVFAEGVFGVIQYEKNRWNINTGLRFDALQFSNNDNYLENGDQSGDETFTSFSPSLGLNYTMGRQKIFTNFSSAFEAPTTTELVNRPDGLGGFNNTLEPEKTWSIETGIRGTFNNATLSYDIALYSMWINSLLLPFQSEDSDRTFFRNEGKSRHTGAEVVVETKLFKNINWLVNYNWNFAEFRQGSLNGTSLDGNRIPGVSPHRLFSELTYQFNKFSISGELRHVDGFHPDSPNNFQVENYTILNAKAAGNNFKISPSIELSPFLAVNNITDKTYSSSISVNARGNRFFEPGADLNFEIGLTLNFTQVNN